VHFLSQSVLANPFIVLCAAHIKYCWRSRKKFEWSWLWCRQKRSGRRHNLTLEDNCQLYVDSLDSSGFFCLIGRILLYSPRTPYESIQNSHPSYGYYGTHTEENSMNSFDYHDCIVVYTSLTSILFPSHNEILPQIILMEIDHSCNNATRSEQLLNWNIMNR